MDRSMFLIEKGHIVVIRNAAGEEITFSTIADFKKYCPVKINLAQYDYIDYEPVENKNICRRKNTADNKYEKLYSAELALLGLVLDDFDNILVKKENPFYQKTDEEIKIIKISAIRNETLSAIRQVTDEIDIWRDRMGVSDDKTRHQRDDQIRQLLINLDVEVEKLEPQ